MQFDHIVIPTDFSPVAENAMTYGAEIARKLNVRVTLAHVYERPYTSVAYQGIITGTVDNEKDNQFREKILEELKKTAATDVFSGVQVTAKLIADKSIYAFHEDISSENALIVMGTAGMTGVMHGGLVGTNTERVIRHAKQAVMSVPKDAKFTGYSRILFATDFNEDVTEAYKRTVAFAKLFDSDLEVAVVNTRNNYASRNQAEGGFNALQNAVAYPKASLTIYNEDSVELGIRDLTEQHHINLLAMVTHGRTGLAHLLRGSIVEDLSATLETPILALKAGS